MNNASLGKTAVFVGLLWQGNMAAIQIQPIFKVFYVHMVMKYGKIIKTTLLKSKDRTQNILFYLFVDYLL